MLAAYPVHSRDQVVQAVWTIEIPVAELVLLRIEVFLAARLARLVLEQFERRTIDAVVSAERRGEHETRHESGPASEL